MSAKTDTTFPPGRLSTVQVDTRFACPYAFVSDLLQSMRGDVEDGRSVGLILSSAPLIPTQHVAKRLELGRPRCTCGQGTIDSRPLLEALTKTRIEIAGIGRQRLDGLTVNEVCASPNFKERRPRVVVHILDQVGPPIPPSIERLIHYAREIGAHVLGVVQNHKIAPTCILWKSAEGAVAEVLTSNAAKMGLAPRRR